jgi:hypothetical protein
MSQFFKEATSDGRRLKMYIYGGEGVGKTVSALQFPAPAVIDTQKGTDYYVDSFDFAILDAESFGKDSSDPDFIEEVIEDLAMDPGPYKTFVIDSMTDVCDKILQKRIQYRKDKTGKTEYELNPADYGWVKGYVKKFIHNLLALDMNIIATAESANEYSSTSGDFMEVIGTKPEGHKKIPHLFDVVIELTKEGEQRRAHVKKDRTRKLPENFIYSYDALLGYLDKDNLEKEPDKNVQSVNFGDRPDRNTEIEFKGKMIKTAGVKADTLEQIESLTEGLDTEKVKAILRNDYLSNSVLDLKNDEAKLFIKQLNELLTPQD